MQRPLHLRYLQDEDVSTNKSPYVPSYGEMVESSPPPQTPGGFYYPTYLPTQPSGSPPQQRYKQHRRASDSSSLPAPVSEPSILNRRPTASHQRTHSALERPKKVYDAPITYGSPQNSPPPVPLKAKMSTKKRRVSESHQVDRMAAVVKRQSKRDSLVDYGQGHIFISFSASGALKLKHVPRGVQEPVVLDAILARWRSGIQSSRRQGADWQINLHGDPWTCKGEMDFQARRIVVIVFQILGDAGYNYVSAVSSDAFSGSPTLIFALTPSYFPSHFFCLSFSASRRKLYIIDAPDVLVPIIVGTVRQTIKEATKGDWAAEGVYEMDIATEKIPKQDLPIRLSQLLQAIGMNGYRFDASVSMGREGMFGMSGRREVWIFRSNSSMPGVMLPG